MNENNYDYTIPVSFEKKDDYDERFKFDFENISSIR